MAKRPNLLSDTLNLLKKAKARDISYNEVCRRTGLKSLWLQKVKNGKMRDPSVRRVQLLHDWLTDKLAEANV